MKRINREYFSINFFILLIIINGELYSQPDFKIKVEKFEWITYDNVSYKLKIYAKISNVGNQVGVCEDVTKLRLMCSEDYYQDAIYLVDLNKNLLLPIEVNDFRTGYVIFSVPKFADSLTLCVGDLTDLGSRKFITESYFKTFKKDPNEKSVLYFEEANSLFSNGNYSIAAYYYKKALESSKINVSDIKKKISKCYLILGNLMNDSGKFKDALTSYKNAIKYENTSELKTKMSIVLEKIGDEELRKGNSLLAQSYYEEGVELNWSNESIKSKLAKLLEQMGDGFYQSGFLNAALDKYYESLKILFDKNVFKKYENVLDKVNDN